MPQIEVQGITVDIIERRATEDGRGHTTVKVGTRTGTVHFIIDPKRLAYLAARALRSKRLRATALHGAMLIKVVGKPVETRIPVPSSR